MKREVIALIVACTAFPAYAGAPDNPGEPGRIVNRDKAYWQDKSGDKNAWGTAVSGVAREEGSNKDKSLGAFLGYMAGGPNPFSDQGTGNN